MATPIGGRGVRWRKGDTTGATSDTAGWQCSKHAKSRFKKNEGTKRRNKSPYQVRAAVIQEK